MSKNSEVRSESFTALRVSRAVHDKPGITCQELSALLNLSTTHIYRALVARRDIGDVAMAYIGGRAQWFGADVVAAHVARLRQEARQRRKRRKAATNLQQRERLAAMRAAKSGDAEIDEPVRRIVPAREWRAERIPAVRSVFDLGAA